jgi:SAM-dependent methyltransferase
MGAAWDRASNEYLARRGNDVGAVSFGNLAPTDRELRLLGELSAKRILDIGCGGGQNSVACALAGATVVGVDISSMQIAAAQRLALAHKSAVLWRQIDASELDVAVLGRFDTVLALQSLQYMDDPAKVIELSRTLLHTGGTFIASFDHPLRNCFFDEELDEFSPFPLRSYGNAAVMPWNFGEQGPMWSYHHPLGQWIEWVVGAGFRLQRVIEAHAPRELCDDLWPEDSPLAPLRLLPHTAILVAQAA